MRKIVTLRQALTDTAYFGGQLSGDSWARWRVLLLAILGEPLEPDELVDQFLGSAHMRGIPSKQYGVYTLVQ